MFPSRRRRKVFGWKKGRERGEHLELRGEDKGTAANLHSSSIPWGGSHKYKREPREKASVQKCDFYPLKAENLIMSLDCHVEKCWMYISSGHLKHFQWTFEIFLVHIWNIFKHKLCAKAMKYNTCNFAMFTNSDKCEIKKISNGEYAINASEALESSEI